MTSEQDLPTRTFSEMPGLTWERWLEQTSGDMVLRDQHGEEWFLHAAAHLTTCDQCNGLSYVVLARYPVGRLCPWCWPGLKR